MKTFNHNPKENLSEALAPAAAIALLALTIYCITLL